VGAQFTQRSFNCHKHNALKSNKYLLHLVSVILKISIKKIKLGKVVFTWKISRVFLNTFSTVIPNYLTHRSHFAEGI